jgi:hypothetical protein
MVNAPGTAVSHHCSSLRPITEVGSRRRLKLELDRRNFGKGR